MKTGTANRGIEMTLTARRTEPEPMFTEPNLHVLQMHSAGEWLDYSSIKTPQEMRVAVMNVKNSDGRMRIVKKQMGTMVVFVGPITYHP